MAKLQETFGVDCVEQALPRYLEEPRGRFYGSALPLMRPSDTQEVSRIVHYCYRHDIAIIPYGGGTGLVGGQLVNSDRPAIIISLERMQKIKHVFPNEYMMQVEAGTTLEAVRSAAQHHNRLFPLSLGSQGTCSIGGNLATNAGGINVLRYGTMRDLCFGIEAVLPDGSIYNGLRRLRKDNMGYDLRNLLIGSEGTLGIITQAVLRLYSRPINPQTVLFEIINPDTALDLLSDMQDYFDGRVIGFELLHKNCFEFCQEAEIAVSNPFEKSPDWAVLLEVGGVYGKTSNEILEQILSTYMEQGKIGACFIAQSDANALAFWKLREAIPEANRKIGAIASHDIALPLAQIMAFIRQMNEKLTLFNGLRVNCFGHLGDGNLHYNIFPPKGGHKCDYMHLSNHLADLVYDTTYALGGSISAEHGIGRLKRDALVKYGDPAKLTIMRTIKSAIDSKGIMNPGAVL